MEGDRDARLRQAFLTVFGREPTAEELSAACRFLDEQPSLYAGIPDGPQQAWRDLCQMLLASNAFLTVE
jgi:hypothetical protein